MKTLLTIYFLATFLQAKSQDNLEIDIYDLVNSLTFKNNDDTINKRPYLSISPYRSIGPWLTVHSAYKPFDAILSSADINFMIQQANNFDSLAIWKQDKLKKISIYDYKKQETKGAYHIEFPVFNKDRQYAIIKVAYHCGNLCGTGCWRLYKKTDKGWQKISSDNCWEA